MPASVDSATARTTAATSLFDGIPKDATPICPPPFAPAVLAVSKSSNDTDTCSQVIEIGAASQVVPNRNALQVGRQAATCDIRITHKSLSRQHALLYYSDNHDSPSTSSPTRGQQLFVFDLDTKSGTFVNQQRIPPKTHTELKHGDSVQFGKAPAPIFTIQWNKEVGVAAKKESSNNDIPETTTTVPVAASIDPFEGLSGRERRQAEIAAMMESLDATPTYTRYTPTAAELAAASGSNSKPTTTGTAKNPLPPTQQKLIQKHHLPFTDSTEMFFLGEDSSNFSTTTHNSISCMVMDPTGARFAIGSMDSSLKLYDFAGFNPIDPSPFQNILIESGYPIRSLAYSSTGDRLLIATGSVQPYVVDRDGQEIIKFVRGDVYVRDPTKTSGHTAPVTGVGWHPLEKSIVFTISHDGSLRVWNVDKGSLSFDMLKCQEVVAIKHLQTGRKAVPTCMTVSSTTIAMGTECGSLQIYKYPFVSKLRPQQSAWVVRREPKTAKEEESKVVSLIYSVDTSKIATRTKDGVTVWNTSGRLSTSSSPWMTCETEVPLADLDNSTPTMAFSPSGKLLCVATSSRGDALTDNKKSFFNALHIYLVPKESRESRDKQSTVIYSVPIWNNDQSPMQFPLSGIAWHFKLNQVLVTTKQSFQIWYSTEWSKKGILLTRGCRRKRQAEADLQELYSSRAPPPGSVVREEHIIVPNALPLFGGEQRKKKKQRNEEEHEQELAKHIPQKPAKGVYDTTNNMFTQMIMDSQTSEKIQMAGMDPREALAKYSEGKSYISGAYEGNVERILTEKTVEEEEEEMKKTKK